MIVGLKFLGVYVCACFMHAYAYNYDAYTYPMYAHTHTLCWENIYKNIVLYLIQKHAVEYKHIYFIHERYHATSKFRNKE